MTHVLVFCYVLLCPIASHCNTRIVTIENPNDEYLAVFINAQQKDIAPKTTKKFEFDNKRGLIHRVVEHSTGNLVLINETK